MRKVKISVIVLGVVFLAALLFSCFLRQQYVVPIVMYHSVIPGADPNNRLAVTPQAFERQMRFLKAFGYNVVSLEKIAELIKNKKKIPPRTVALTFDDGYKNIYTYAFPVLKKYRLPATAFIIVKEVGRPQNDRLSWDEIKEMRASGIFDIGSHCLGPEPLVNLKSEQELRNEIFDSKRILEEKLGSGVSTFSYPEGRFNQQIRQLVIDAGYKLAVATSPGRKFPDNDAFALKRLRISSSSDSLFVYWVETSGFYTFIKEHRDDD